MILLNSEVFSSVVEFCCPQARALASFLSMVLQNKQLLSNKALHLFLQTGLSMQVTTIPRTLPRPSRATSRDCETMRWWSTR